MKVKNRFVSAYEPGHHLRVFLKYIVVLWISSVFLLGCGNSSPNDKKDNITTETLEVAGKIADISLTDRERKSSINSLSSQ